MSLAGEPVRGAAHLTPGLGLPALELPSTMGLPVDLSRHPGAAVVYVYPWTGRPGYPDPPDWDVIPGAHGSTPQAAGFAKLHDQYMAAGFSVFGLSGQTSAEQQEFALRMQLPFALLSDHGAAFAAALRLPMFATGGVDYLTRLTLVVRDGAIVEAIFPVPEPEAHAAALLAHLVPR